MRTIVVVLVVLLALMAVFAGMAAVGFLRLQQLHSAALKPAAAPPPPAPAPAVNAQEPRDWTITSAAQITAAAQIPGEAPAPRDVAEAPEPAAKAVDLAALPPLPKSRIVLSALEATVRGREIRVELEKGMSHVAGWRDPEASVSWDIGPRRQGRYAVEVSLACGDNAGGAFTVSTAEEQVAGRARPTGGPRAYQTVAVGAITLPPEGATLTLRGRERSGDELMNVREVRLLPLP